MNKDNNWDFKERTNLQYTVNGRKRRIPAKSVQEDTEHSFIVSRYYGRYIEVYYDELYGLAELPKSWYAICYDENGVYAFHPSFVGRTKEEAIQVCMNNIFFK